MIRPFRWQLNVQTGERKQVELTDEEIVRAETKQAAEDVANAVRAAEAARKASRQTRLDALLDKLEADPTIIDRIR